MSVEYPTTSAASIAAKRLWTCSWATVSSEVLEHWGIKSHRKVDLVVKLQFLVLQTLRLALLPSGAKTHEGN